MGNSTSPSQCRRSIRVPAYDYAAPGAYFVTIVAHQRACLFGSIDREQMQLAPGGRIADECWRSIPAHFPHAELSTYVVMPNHVHGIIVLHENERAAFAARRGTIYRAPTPPVVEQFQKPVSGSIPTIIRTYKAAVTRLIARELGSRSPVWQRNYYEHIIRNDDELNRIHIYIESNILNWADDEENPVKEPSSP